MGWVLLVLLRSIWHLQCSSIITRCLWARSYCVLVFIWFFWGIFVSALVVVCKDLFPTPDTNHSKDEAAERGEPTCDAAMHPAG